MINERIQSKVLKVPMESKEGDLIDLIDEYVKRTSPNLKIERQEPGQAPSIEIRDPKIRINAIRIEEDNCTIKMKSPLTSRSAYSIVEKVDKPRKIKLVRDLGLGYLKISTDLEERGILSTTGKASVGETFEIGSEPGAYEHENFEINCRCDRGKLKCKGNIEQTKFIPGGPV